MNHALLEWQVIKAMYELDQAFDMKDWNAVRTFFAARVTVKVGVITGADPVPISAEDFVAQIAAFNPPEKLAMHTLTNPLVHIEGDKSVFQANRYGWNWCEHFDQPLYELWGRVRYVLNREGPMWKIAEFELVKLRDAGNLEVNLYRA